MCWYVLGSDDGASITTTEVEESSEPDTTAGLGSPLRVMTYFPEVPAGEFELWHGLGSDDGASITTTEVVEFSEPETIAGLISSSVDEFEGEEETEDDAVVEIINVSCESEGELEIQMWTIEQESERMRREDVKGHQRRVDERFAVSQALLRRVRESIARGHC